MCGNGGAGDGEDSGLSSWLVRVCACVTGKRGVYRALLWGKRGLDRRDVREWGVSDREDSGLGGWVVRVCACVAGKPVVSGLGGV